MNLVGYIVRVAPFVAERLALGFERRHALLLLLGHRDFVAREHPHPASGIEDMLLGRIDPLPAFAPDPQRLSLELRGDEPVEQADIGQPPAMIRFEQVARSEEHTSELQSLMSNSYAGL